MARIYLAWVDELYTTFVPATHAVLDEQFRMIVLRQQENLAATGEITFPNPGVGLLSSSRRRFVLISESESDDPAEAVLVARARIVGMPTDFRADLITTEIICGPDDLDERLADAAEAHFELPWTDVLYGDERRDPTAAIAARGCSWHIDPRTHEITITDVLGGGPVVDIGFDHAGDFSIRLTEPPLKKATQKVVVTWTQSAEGWVDISDLIGPTTTLSSGTTATSVNATAQYVIGQPEVEFEPTDIEINSGVGWTLGQNAYEVTDSDTIAVHFGWSETTDYSGFVYSHSVRYGAGGLDDHWRHYYDTAGDAQKLAKRIETTRVWTYDWEQLVVSYRYTQPRVEEITLEMEMPTQDVMGAVSSLDLGELQLFDPTDDPETPVWFPGRPGLQGEAVLHDGKRWTYKEDGAPTFLYLYSSVNGSLRHISTPYFDEAPSIAALPNRRAPAFVGSDRAVHSVEHGLLLLRARLRYRLRCLEATVRPGDWAVMRDVSMDQSIRADHPRFGAVTGKVIAWDRAWLGDNGGRSGTIAIGAALGTGSTGSGQIADVAYTVDADDTVVPVNAYLLPLAGYSVLDVAKEFVADEQLDLVTAEIAAGRDPSAALSKAATQVSVVMRPLTTVNAIQRRIKVSANLLDSPMGYDAGAD